jgi:hypothetical protein
MNHVWENAEKFEHRFWLQILGDHSRFIYESLAPVEKENIRRASEFIQIFDTLLSQVNSADLSQLTIMAENETLKLREFKLNLIKKHLLGKIKHSIFSASLKNIRWDFTKPYKNTERRKSYLSMSKIFLF